MSSGANAFEITDFQEDETAVWFARITVRARLK